VCLHVPDTVHNVYYPVQLSTSNIDYRICMFTQYESRTDNPGTDAWKLKRRQRKQFTSALP